MCGAPLFDWTNSGVDVLGLRVRFTYGEYGFSSIKSRFYS